MIFVLDASAMIAYLRDEAGSGIAQSALASGDHVCVAHSLNLCEVFYDFHRAAGLEVALAVIRGLNSFGLQENNAMDAALWQSAAEIKSVWRRISLADCFALALAKRLNATLLTSDHHELDPIAAANVCQIEFIR